jgi:hypothetical protein
MKDPWILSLVLVVGALLVFAGWLRAAAPFEKTIVVDAAAGAGTVRAFGAKGDGASDDTAAIERAVREMTEGRIEFPRGDYRITRTIEIRLGERGPITLSGRGGTARVTMAGEGPAFRFVGTHKGTADPESFGRGVYERERMPAVEGIEIVGAHPEADGIEFFQVMQPTLSGVLIRDVRHGVRLVTRNRNLLVTGCHIYNCRGVGIFFDRVNVHQAIISGSHISYCKGGGIKIVGSEIRNLQITGNDIEYNFDPAAEESADVWIDSREGTVREGTIVSNTIQAKPSPGGANVRFIGSPAQKDAGLWTIQGNLISSQTVNIHVRHCRGMVISGNTIFSAAERNVLLENSRHIVVAQQSQDRNPDYKGELAGGVTVRECDGVVLNALQIHGAEGGSADAGGAIEVIRSRETSIGECQVFEPKFRGVYVEESRNTRVGNCLIVEREGAARMLAAIEVRGKSPGTVVTGNQTTRGTRGDLVLPAEGVSASGNVGAVR